MAFTEYPASSFRPESVALRRFGGRLPVVKKVMSEEPQWLLPVPFGPKRLRMGKEEVQPCMMSRKQEASQ